MTAREHITRYPHWRPRLVAYLAEVSPASFRLGSQDCALFAAGAVRAMTGYDPAAGFRGAYTDLRSGLKRLRAAGYDNVPGLADALFGRIDPVFAQVGDLACIETPEGPALGVFAGETIACLNERGLAHMPRAAATIAWQVP